MDGSDTIVAGQSKTYPASYSETIASTVISLSPGLVGNYPGIIMNEGTLTAQKWAQNGDEIIVGDKWATKPVTVSSATVSETIKDDILSSPSSSNGIVISSSHGNNSTYKHGTNYGVNHSDLTSEQLEKLSNAKDGDYLKISFDITLNDESNRTIYFIAYGNNGTSEYSAATTYAFDPKNAAIKCFGKDNTQYYLDDINGNRYCPSNVPIHTEILIPLDEGGTVKNGDYICARASYTDTSTNETVIMTSQAFTGKGEVGYPISAFKASCYDSSASGTSGSTITNATIALCHSAASISKTVDADRVGDTYEGTDGKAQTYKADFELGTGKTYAAPTVEWQVTNSVGTYRRSKTYDNVAAENAADSYYGLVITYGEDDGYIENPTVSATFESASVTDTSTN